MVAGSLIVSTLAATPYEKIRTQNQLNQEQMITNDTIEISYNYDYLDPNDLYGYWNNITLSYYHKQSETLTIFGELGGYSRTEEGEAVLFSLGAYKDWSPGMFTYTQITGATENEYLPKFNINHDFNIKFGENQQWVLILGGAYVKYHDIHEDYVLSPGISYYGEKFNITYRPYFNISNPGKKKSTNHLISFGYGQEKDQWTYFDIAFGNESYLPIIDNSTVDEKIFRTRLSHRHWLSNNSGFFGAVEYFNMKDEYDRGGFQIGYFKEF